jgi:PAS domain S-box-containing protein
MAKRFHSRIGSTQEVSGFFSPLILVCVVATLSYLVPKLEGSLISNPQTVWPLWPGCAILVSVLLLVPLRIWPILILSALAGFVLYDLQVGVPVASIAWFMLADIVQVLIAALGLRYCFEGVPRLNGIKALAKYSIFALILAPFAAAFLSAHGISGNYWTGWRVGVFSEVLAFVTVTPAILSWVTELRGRVRKSYAYHLEAAALITMMVMLGYVTFTASEKSSSPVLLYSLVPLLLWSALRFGAMGVSTSVVVVAFLSIWGAVHGRGPFAEQGPTSNWLPLQLFLIFAAIPFMALAALTEERRQSEEAIRESEERFRLVANTAPVLIWMSGPDKLCTYFNQPWLEFTGRPIEAELGNGWAAGVYPEDLKACLDTYTHAFDSRESFKRQYRLRRHDGEYRWFSDVGVPRLNPDRSFAGYIGSCIDVTEAKLAQEALAGIGHRLIEAHEEERTWIARELHDDVNQRIALLAIELERWNQQVPGSAVEFHDHIHQVRERLLDISKDIQSLSHRLHSSKLEYLGLVTATKSFCNELSEQQSVQIDFSHAGIPRNLSKEISLCLFRVLQEALQNAVKHSGGRRFKVELRGALEEIQLTVNDQGVGFEQQDAVKRRGLGLISMRERLQLVHGEISIKSQPGVGTNIHARVPFSSSSDSGQMAG